MVGQRQELRPERVGRVPVLLLSRLNGRVGASERGGLAHSDNTALAEAQEANSGGAD